MAPPARGNVHYLRRIDFCITQLLRVIKKKRRERPLERVVGGAAAKLMGRWYRRVRVSPIVPSYPHYPQRGALLRRWRAPLLTCQFRIVRSSHPGGNPVANLKSISHRCHPILVACVWELTEATIDLLLGCLQGGEGAPPRSRDAAQLAPPSGPRPSP